MIIEELGPKQFKNKKTENTKTQVIPKDKFQKYWLKLPKYIRMILVVPMLLFAAAYLAVTETMKYLWKNKYWVIGIVGTIAAIYSTLLAKYGADRLAEAAKVLLGGFLLIIIIKNFFFILSLLFYSGIIYLIYWAVMHALTR
jgi:uncharacterized membrane protein